MRIITTLSKLNNDDVGTKCVRKEPTYRYFLTFFLFAETQNSVGIGPGHTSRVEFRAKIKHGGCEPEAPYGFQYAVKEHAEGSMFLKRIVAVTKTGAITGDLS
ncbi:hypothetical protein CEXT_417731 [Caerostris extrusa]|uniref:Uncharacterized protein n=1 Tax=Caerostris extrusa TaxID=172846 RepID=A0AAV4PZU3_CAEEX|nr:hypothetical protein CEXT_417731 [Caerostris extrusa]